MSETYVNDICLNRPRYKGPRIAVTHSAMLELMQEGKALDDVVMILEQGYNAPRKRKTGTIEKWLDRGNKTFNAVVAKDCDEIMKKDCWVLIHFGKFTRKKR